MNAGGIEMKKWIDIGVQALLGLIFFVFGLNGFLHFLAEPEVSGDAATYMGGLAATGFFFPVLKAVEVVGGFLLLIRKFPALALVLLAPVVVHVFLFHAYLAPEGLVMAVPILLIEAYLGFGVYRDRFKDVLKA
jgi:putative oxidoreductase